MPISTQQLIEKEKLQILTLGGKSPLSFKFNALEIEVTNSSGRKKRFTWDNLEVVYAFCEHIGFNKTGKVYNPMDGGSFPEDYPRHMDTLSLVSLAHFMADMHKHRK
ncbi:hypothetical protein ACRN93_21960 [Shewanella baltica]|uniref:hypothetical protein n=1 Tax=Shewanella baltica TaxID=62322 RepID=UPI003D7A7C81